jgi:hypothetical protein
MIRPEDIRQMARLGIAASLQPANLMTDRDLVDDTLEVLLRDTDFFRDALPGLLPPDEAGQARIATI